MATYRQTLLLIILAILFSCRARKSFTIKTPEGLLTVEEVAGGISVPYAIDFLPDGRMLFTDRPSGKIFLVDVTSGSKTLLQGVPEVLGEGDGGMI